MTVAIIIRPRSAPRVEVDDETAICLLRVEASRLAALSDPIDLALSAALTRGAEAILNERTPYAPQD